MAQRKTSECEELGPAVIRRLEDIPVEPGAWVGDPGDE